MKDEGNAMNYRCKIDTGVVVEKQESADINGRWKHLKSTVIKAAELTLGHKTTGLLVEERKIKTFRIRQQNIYH